MLVTHELAARMAEGSVPEHPVLALPGFDEFLLGYKDRSLQLPADGMAKVVPGNNGMFRATVVADGQAVAVWTKKDTAKAMKISVQPLSSLSSKVSRSLEAAFAPYAHFIAKPVQISVDGD